MTITPDEFAEKYKEEREGKTGRQQMRNRGWKSWCGEGARGKGRGGGKLMSKQRNPQKQGQMLR